MVTYRALCMHVQYVRRWMSMFLLFFLDVSTKRSERTCEGKNDASPSYRYTTPPRVPVGPQGKALDGEKRSRVVSCTSNQDLDLHELIDLSCKGSLWFHEMLFNKILILQIRCCQASGQVSYVPEVNLDDELSCASAGVRVNCAARQGCFMHKTRVFGGRQIQ